jgi:hypothetical protein
MSELKTATIGPVSIALDTSVGVRLPVAGSYVQFQEVAFRRCAEGVPKVFHRKSWRAPMARNTFGTVGNA